MLNFIILGAGKGTRMVSSTSKVMHKIAGKSMIEIVIDLASSFNPTQIITVFSEENYKEAESLGFTNAVIQKERLGTGHAVLNALTSLNSHGKTFILYGDTPLITKETLESMQNQDADITVLGFKGEIQEKYGRLVISNDEIVEKVVEFKDLTNKEKDITLFNSGVFLVKTDVLKALVPQISNNNNAGEYYLTDIISLARKNNLKTKFILCQKDEVLGVNNRIELAKCEEIMQNRLRKKHLTNGVTLISPSSIFFSLDTKIENDVIVEPNVFFGKGCEIRKGCHIKAFSYLEDCKIEEEVSIGPFARIRGRTTIGAGSKIGNFVEVKNSNLEKGVKAGHLAYVGDGEVGENVNIGAGAIFCNYDGKKKHKTIIDKNVFIGSNTSLIAPLKIESNAILGAGSVITKNVEEYSLAIERGAQKNIPNYKKKKYKKKD